MATIIPANHFFLSKSSDIQEICKPLQTHLNITSFVFVRSFADGSDLKLGNNANWLEFYYDHKLYQVSQLENHPQFYQKGFVLWSTLKDHYIVLKHARNDFDIDHGITYLNPNKNYNELFFYGTKRVNRQAAINYINHLDLLKKFADYFTTIAKPIIDEAYNHRIYIPEKFDAIKVPPQSSELSTDKIKFLNSLKSSETRKEVLSKREWQVCQKLMQGKTAKDIADELFLSRRTVETHIANIKNKFYCRTKSELITRLAIDYSAFMT